MTKSSVQASPAPRSRDGKRSWEPMELTTIGRLGDIMHAGGRTEGDGKGSMKMRA